MGADPLQAIMRSSRPQSAGHLAPIEPVDFRSESLIFLGCYETFSFRRIKTLEPVENSRGQRRRGARDKLPARSSEPRPTARPRGPASTCFARGLSTNRREICGTWGPGRSKTIPRRLCPIPIPARTLAARPPATGASAARKRRAARGPSRALGCVAEEEGGPATSIPPYILQAAVTAGVTAHSVK